MSDSCINRPSDFSGGLVSANELVSGLLVSDTDVVQVNILLAGVSYRTAAVSLREKLAFNCQQAISALKSLRVKYPGSGFVLLSTCNRVELYCSVASGTALTVERLKQELVTLRGFGDDQVEYDIFYGYSGREAVYHLLEVSSSLDSLVLGESQIIAQVRDAYYAASQAGVTDKVINRLFHCAFSCSKEVYATTSIAQRRVSVASVAVFQAARELGSLAEQKVAVVGVGEMGELIIRHLKNAGCREITVVNRTLRRSQLLAGRLGLNYADWSDIKSVFVQADLIVAAANAGEFVFDLSFMPGQSEKARVIIDVAVPRNFDPAVGSLANVRLLTIDDLAAVVSDNMQARQEDIEQARRIIKDDTDSFIEWFGVMDVGPMVGRLRHKFHDLAQDELAKLYSCLKPLDETSRQQIDTAVARIVNKYLHSLVIGFYQHARDVDPKTVTKLISQIVQQEHRADKPQPKVIS